MNNLFGEFGGDQGPEVGVVFVEFKCPNSDTGKAVILRKVELDI